MRGKILSVICGTYNVYLEDFTTISIKPRGVFRHLNIKMVVGDVVEVENNSIIKVLPRKNYLIRPMISNIDVGIIVSSLEEPPFSSYLLDKFLVMLNQQKIKPLIVLSKKDLEDDKQKIDRIVKEYHDIGLEIIPFSKRTLEGLEEIKAKIKGLTVMFAGQTGVGKSSLINAINPEIGRAIGEYSTSLNRGKHQTKEVAIFPYEDGYIADTPGFSSLEVDCYKEELKNFFPFFQNVPNKCFYNDCCHISEPKCEIINQVRLNKIPQEHYYNYKDIFEKLFFRKDRFK